MANFYVYTGVWVNKKYPLMTSSKLKIEYKIKLQTLQKPSSLGEGRVKEVGTNRKGLE